MAQAAARRRVASITTAIITATVYTPPPPTYRAPTLIPVNEMPDYKPPLGSNGVRADMDGNLWIRVQQMKPVAGGVIYDVVNRAGVMVDRLQLPTGYTIAGFGKGRVVYLSMARGDGVAIGEGAIAVGMLFKCHAKFLPDVVMSLTNPYSPARVATCMWESDHAKSPAHVSRLICAAPVTSFCRQDRLAIAVQN